MGNELGNKTDVDLLLVSFVTSTPIFILIGNNDFVNEYSEKKWLFLVAAGISVRSSRNSEHDIILHTQLFCICSVMSGSRALIFKF